MAQRRYAPGGKQKPWTEEENALVRNDRLSVAVVARRTGRSRAAVYQRRHALGLTAKQGRTGEGNFVNVFSGLIRNARVPHDSYIVVTRHDGNGPSKALLNRGHAEGGKGNSRCWLFQLAPFERAILSCLREVDPREVLPAEGDTAGVNKAKELQDALAGIEAELAEAAMFMEQHGFSVTVGKRVAVLEARKTELGKELLDAKAEVSCPAEAAWKEYGSLLDALDKAPDQRDARLRLRSVLRRMVSEIRLLVVPRKGSRLAAVQIHFTGGGRRDYWIWFMPPRANAKARKVGFWKVRSWRAEDLARIGLRQSDLRDIDADEPEGTEHYLLALTTEQLDRLAFYKCPAQPLP